MAATVIDALVVTLGLDPAKFTEGQKKALQEFKKTKDEAKKHAKDLEEEGKKNMETFSGLTRSVLSFLGVAATVSGSVAFFKNTVFAEAALGRLSRNLGVSTEALSIWGGAAKEFGGSAEATVGTIQGLTQSLRAGWQLGIPSGAVPYFRRLGIELTDANGKLKDASVWLKELNVAFNKLGPEGAFTIGTLMGLDPGTIDMLEQTPEKLQKVLDKMDAVNKVTKEQAEASEALGAQWNRELSILEGFGRSAVSFFKPLLSLLLTMDEIKFGWMSKLGELPQWLVNLFVGPGIFPATGETPGKAPAASAPGAGAGLLGLVRKLEGSGDSAVSPAGAIGRNQIMPATARQYGFDPSRLKDPAYNDTVATAILDDLSKKYRGNTDMIMAAYNGGPGVANRLARTGDPGNKETRNYLSHLHRILADGHASAGAAGSVSNRTSTASTEIHIAQLNVTTPDAKSFSRDLQPALQTYGLAAQANTGLN